MRTVSSISSVEIDTNNNILVVRCVVSGDEFAFGHKNVL